MSKLSFGIASMGCCLLVTTLLSYLEPGTSLWGGPQARFSPALDNLIIIIGLGLVLIIAWGLSKHYFGASDQQTNRNILAALSGATLSFLLIACIYFSYEQFAEINRPRKLLLIGWVLPFLIAMILHILKPVSASNIWAAQGIYIIIFLIILDSSYRLGVHKNPVAGLEQHAYHWNITRQAEQNYKNTPVRYLDEIRQLGNHIPPDSRFFSDKFTSYYIKSVLPLYAINAKGHHRNHRDYSLGVDTIRLLCQPKISQQDFKAIFQSISDLQTEFAIINHDENNGWLGTDCIYRNSGDIERYLEQNYARVFKGAVLSAYKLE